MTDSGGSAAAAEVDALDEETIDQHLQSVIDKASGMTGTTVNLTMGALDD